MDIFGVLIYQPVFNLMVVLYRLFSENLGLAIVVIALLSRLITIPIVLKQKKTMASAQEMNTKLKAIREKHKNNKEQRDKELMEVQSQYMPAQLAGCLPLILQLILFINVYNVISGLVVQGVESFNTVAYSFVPKFDAGYQLNYSFIGFDLSKHPGQFSEAGFLAFLPYILIMIVIGLTQYYSMKYSMNPTAKSTEDKSKKDEKKGKNKTEGNAAKEDFAEAMQRSTQQTMFMFPILYTFLSYNFPVGLSLYWIVQNTFVIIQQFVMKRLELRKLQAKENLN